MAKQIKVSRLNILILCQSQFGYHVDTYFYCQYLRERHKLTYLCWDYDRPKQKFEQVIIKYVSRNGNLVIRNVRYFIAAVQFLINNPVDICFIKYFRGCSMLRLFFPHIRFVFDIRTGSVSDNRMFRFFYDKGMWLESLVFKDLTVISRSLAKKMYLEKKATILPLGSVIICNKKKQFNSMDLLYVGTLSNRNIEKTILGFADFLDSKPLSLQCSYTVIGSGYNGEEEQLRILVKKLDLKNHIKVVGYVPFSKLSAYFEKANIGVSFVPMTPFYDVQPVTKTFDYLLSGMAVVGTATSENKLVIDDSNGVLIHDNSESFRDGLSQIYSKKTSFFSEGIRNNANKYHWENIIALFEKYLLKLFHRY